MEPDDALRRTVEDLVADYARMIDDDRVEEWPDYFDDPCVYRIVNRENHAAGSAVGVMECRSRGMLRDRVRALREANVYEPHCYRHLLSGTRILGRTGGAWRAETSFAVIRTMQEGSVSVFASGKYVDDVLVGTGRPRFRSRVVVTDSARVDTLVVIPI